jgi:NTP pyrophosphatase (non-canonical NTP hydrolase)
MNKMSYQEDSIDWQAIRNIDAWLDDNVGKRYKHQPLAQDWARISKVAEELGEAIQAFISYTGQNPRKVVAHNMDDVLRELADVTSTAILAMQHFTKDSAETRDILRQKLTIIEARVLTHRLPEDDDMRFPYEPQ